MFNFDFYNPTHIIFGKDRLDSIDQHIRVEASVLITYGWGSAINLSKAIDMELTLSNILWMQHK